jgi:hypothetical protein
MALSLENSNLVWQKVNVALANAEPAAQKAFAGLKQWLAQQKGNANLQFILIDDADVTGTDGVVSADAACRVYGVYVKKRATATDSFFKLFDDATNDGTAGDQRIVLALLEASETQVFIAPDGLSMGTGIVSTSHTTSQGTTDSTAGDSGDGFLIIGGA